MLCAGAVSVLSLREGAAMTAPSGTATFRVIGCHSGEVGGGFRPDVFRCSRFRLRSRPSLHAVTESEDDGSYPH